MIHQLDELESTARAALDAAKDADALERWRTAYLGSSGKLKEVFGLLKDVPKQDKPAVGARLNALRGGLEEAYAAARESRGAAKPGGQGLVDVTEPGLIATLSRGRRHILTRVTEELVEVFGRMGFAVAQGPELEDDEHNFVKLNIPPGHPAREAIDNFYVDDPAQASSPRMLRSQTSTVQIRVLEEAVRRGGGTLASPVRIIAPGRVYRPDTVDATHSFMFHQLEGLYVDRGVSMADLKGTLLNFARAYFGPEAQIRLRPSFFPFTEPSAELDLKIRFRSDQEPRWVELGGCGMVDPAVFQACGIDPEIWSGFAFGFGIERLAMGKHAVADIRRFYENDIRFLSQV